MSNPAVTKEQKIAIQKLLQDPTLQRLLRALDQPGVEARVVGGAVRDALARRTIGDIDLAINQPPEKTIGLLDAAQIGHAPTGLAHGTVTAILDHRGFEVTSLRRDVATDGRRATIAYTDDWQADAQRRDFTMNALSVDKTGRVYDYTDGVADLAAQRVRFIGDAETRIREDVLRILRYYRFQTVFGGVSVDAPARMACRKLAPLLPQLSAERVWKEITKLLTSADPAPVWQMMMEDGALSHWLPEATNIDALRTLIVCEQVAQETPHALRRLAVLLSCDEEIALKTAKQMKCSNREAEQLCAMAHIATLWSLPPDAHAVRVALYNLKDKDGLFTVRHALLLVASRMAAKEQQAFLQQAFETLKAWTAPTFPLQGQDLLKHGVPAGPQMGDILRAIEAWWIAGDFQADKAACLAQLNLRSI